MMKIVRIIVHVLANICYLGILIYALICLPIIFGYKPLVVISGSMEPTYPVGSIIYYSRVSENELKEKDVIVYVMNDGKYITHRINKIVDGNYQTKGDANNTVDANPVEYSQIKGKVSSVYLPYIGRYVEFVNENTIIIFVVVIILISEFFLQNKKNLDIDKNKKGKERSI